VSFESNMLKGYVQFVPCLRVSFSCQII